MQGHSGYTVCPQEPPSSEPWLPARPRQAKYLLCWGKQRLSYRGCYSRTAPEYCLQNHLNSGRPFYRLRMMTTRVENDQLALSVSYYFSFLTLPHLSISRW